MIASLSLFGQRPFPLRTLALAGTALTAIASVTPAAAVPGSGTTVVNSAADLTNPLDFNGGTLQFNVPLMTANNATLTGTGNTINTNGSNVEMSGVISGGGELIKTGDGQLYLTGANTYSGGTTVSGGELAGDTTSLRGDITNNAIVGFIQNTDGTYSGVMSGTGSLTKVGAGILTLSGSNTFSGGIVLVGGALAISAGSNLGSGTLTINNPTTVRFTNTLSANNTIQLNDAGTFEVTGSNTATLNGPITTTGSIVKTGTGTLVLGGNNTFSGGLRIQEGGIAISSANNLGTGAVTTGLSSSLQINGTLTANNAFQLSGLILIDVTGANTATLGGVISGMGAIAKSGTGTLVLTGSNTYDGQTQMNEGVLSVSADANLGSAGSPLVFNGGTLLVTGSFTTVRNVTSLSTNGGLEVALGQTVTLNGNVEGSGPLTKLGAGTLVLNGNNTQAGLTLGGGTVVASTDTELGSGSINFNGGTLRADAAFSTENNASLLGAGTVDTNGFNLTLSGVISGAGSLTKVGLGTLTLTGANTYTGGTTVSAGTLQGNSGSLVGNITNNAVVEFAQTADGTYAGVLSGSGALVKTGAGTLTLTGTNTYAGGTTVTGGTLAGDTDSLQGAITNNATVSFVQDVDGTYAGNMSGTGRLNKLGAGTLTLSGTNSHSGETFVIEGTLNVTGSIIGGTGDVSIDPGATLTGTGSIGGTVGGPGTLISDAANPLEVGNYDGTGTLHAIIGPSGPALSVSGAATIVGGVIFVNTMNVDGTLAADQTFTALSTGTGIMGEFASITDSSALFDFTGMVMGNDYILRTVAGMTMTEVAETENQREVAGALQGLGTPSDPDLADAVNQLGMLDAAGVRAAYDALAGEINADMATPAIGDAQLFQGSLFQRLGTVAGGNGQSAFSLGQLALDEAGATPEISIASAMAGEAGPAATGVWVRAHGLFGEVNGDDRTGAHDLDHSTAGLMAGYDLALSESTIVGIGAGYAHTDLDLDEVEQEGEIHSYRLAAYGGTRMGALSVRGLVGYAYHDNETERQITIGSFDETAEGDYAGHEFSAAAEVGYLMQLGALGLEPVAGLALTHLSDESYEESGAGVAGLEIDGRSTTSLRSTLGARATFAPAANFRLSASLAWAHELADTEREVDATFLGGGAAFRIQGAEVSRDSALVGVGVGVALGQGIDLTLGYDGQFGADDTAHGAEARLKIGL